MAEWEVQHGAERVGPLDEAHVIRMIEQGLPEGTLVRPVGKEHWKNLRAHAPFAAALEAASARNAPQPSAPAPPVAPSPPKRRLVRPIFAVLLAPVVAFLAFVGHVAYRNRNPESGRFCRNGDPRNCWDLDLGAKTMTIVLPNGQRAFKALPLGPGGAGFDYSVEGLGGTRVEVRIVDRDTIGIRNSQAESPVFAMFFRRPITSASPDPTPALEPDTPSENDGRCGHGATTLQWPCPKSTANKVPLATFKATSSEVPTIFRVSARLSDYYNYDYSGAQKTHYAVEIRDGGAFDPRAKLHAYIARKDPYAADLYDLLKDGEAHAVTVELAYNKRSQSTDVAKLMTFMCAGWDTDYNPDLPPDTGAHPAAPVAYFASRVTVFRSAEELEKATAAALQSDAGGSVFNEMARQFRAGVVTQGTRALILERGPNWTRVSTRIVGSGAEASVGFVPLMWRDGRTGNEVTTLDPSARR